MFEPHLAKLGEKTLELNMDSKKKKNFVRKIFSSAKYNNARFFLQLNYIFKRFVEVQLLTFFPTSFSENVINLITVKVSLLLRQLIFYRKA